MVDRNGGPWSGPRSRVGRCLSRGLVGAAEDEKHAGEVSEALLALKRPRLSQPHRALACCTSFTCICFTEDVLLPFHFQPPGECVLQSVLCPLLYIFSSLPSSKTLHCTHVSCLQRSRPAIAPDRWSSRLETHQQPGVRALCSNFSFTNV